MLNFPPKRYICVCVSSSSFRERGEKYLSLFQFFSWLTCLTKSKRIHFAAHPSRRLPYMHPGFQHTLVSLHISRVSVHLSSCSLPCILSSSPPSSRLLLLLDRPVSRRKCHGGDDGRVIFQWVALGPGPQQQLAIPQRTKARVHLQIPCLGSELLLSFLARSGSITYEG